MQVPERLWGQGLRRFTENLLSLTTLNIASYFFPLILVPILLARLGQINYGIVLFVQSTMAYLLGFTDFGFSLTGTKLISRDRSSPSRVREVFWMIVLTKLALFCLASVALVFVHARTPLLKYEGDLFIWGAVPVFGHILLLDWYFRGTNELRAISIFNFAVRAMSFVLLLLVIHEREDYLMVLKVNGMVTLALGIAVFVACVRRVGFARPRWSWWRVDLDGLWHNGLTGLLNIVSRQGHLLIIRQFLDPAAFAIYGIAFKVVISAYAILSALPQTIFAHMGDKVTDPRRFSRLLRNFLAINVSAYLTAALVLIVGAPLLLRIISIDDSPELFVEVLRRQAVMLVFAGVTTILSATFGVLTGRERILFYTLLAASLAMVVCLVWLHYAQASLVQYAWTVPIMEMVWAGLLLQTYLGYRRKLA